VLSPTDVGGAAAIILRAPTQHFATKGIGTKGASFFFEFAKMVKAVHFLFCFWFPFPLTVTGVLSPEKDGDAYACMVRILFG
jgi:hypothetical protein